MLFACSLVHVVRLFQIRTNSKEAQSLRFLLAFSVTALAKIFFLCHLFPHCVNSIYSVLSLTKPTSRHITSPHSHPPRHYAAASAPRDLDTDLRPRRILQNPRKLRSSQQTLQRHSLRKAIRRDTLSPTRHFEHCRSCFNPLHADCRAEPQAAPFTTRCTPLLPLRRCFHHGETSHAPRCSQRGVSVQ